MATAVRGNRLTLSIDGTEVAPQVKSATIVTSDRDDDGPTFSEAAAGQSKKWSLSVTALQMPQANTLWDQVWSHSGEEVDVIVRPFGNATATAENPHFTGTVLIAEPDGTVIGGDADLNATTRYSIEFTWDFLSKPTRVVA